MIRVLFFLAALGIAGTTATTIMSLLARSNWLFELFSHFPVQYLVVQIVAAAICLGLRQWPWAALALIAAIPNLVAVGPYLPGLVFSATGSGPAPAIQEHSGLAAAPSLSLVALNLLYTREDAAVTREYLTTVSADILVLSELTPRWHEKLRSLEDLYPYSVIRPRWNPWGLALYSKYPLDAIEDLNLGDDSSAHLRVTVRLPGGPVEVYAVHLASPPSARQAAQRNRQFKVLAARIAAADPNLPKIVAGDFNATPWSPYFRDFRQASGLRDARLPFGLHVTWPTWPIPAWIPIDHCMVSAGIVVTEVKTGPDVGSDHWPLVCRFSLMIP
ncbi:MAG: endonuclease/exonuclease/phosphatase family protein [Gammaproteobacteria bacterium]